MDGGDPSGPTPIIRAAQEADYPALAALWRQADLRHAQLQPGFFCPPQAPSWSRQQLRQVLAAADQALLVAELQGEVVGLAALQLYDTPPDPRLVRRQRAYLQELAVSQEHRRQGIGRRLVVAAVSWAREQGAEQLLLTVWQGNELAERFYRALGFCPVSQVLGFELER